MSISKVARCMGWSREYVRGLLDSGRLRHIVKGKRRYVRPETLDAFLTEQEDMQSTHRPAKISATTAAELGWDEFL